MGDFKMEKTFIINSRPNVNVKFEESGHRKLWRWLRDNPTKPKRDWPGWKINGGTYDIVFGYCFACDYDENMHPYGSDCFCCPLIWPYGWDCDHPMGLYKQFIKEEDLEKKAKIAGMIAELQIREGVELSEEV
jgi:hypothetical protein